MPPHTPRTPLMPGEFVPSPLLRACSAAQLLQHFPLAKIVLFNEHAETAFRPRFFICFPQTRKKRYRGSLEGGEGGNMHTQRHKQIHVETHRAEPLEMVEWQAEPCDWSGEGSGDRKSFFDPITGDVHRGGK